LPVGARLTWAFRVFSAVCRLGFLTDLSLSSLTIKRITSTNPTAPKTTWNGPGHQPQAVDGQQEQGEQHTHADHQAKHHRHAPIVAPPSDQSIADTDSRTRHDPADAATTGVWATTTLASVRAAHADHAGGR
jgi:hypothetical protein